MDVRFVWTAARSELGAGRSLVSSHPTEDLPELLARTDGLVWVDIPSWDDEAETGARPTSSASTRWRSGTAWSAIRCRRCTCIRATSSWCCTPRSAARPGTCTTSSWTSSSATELPGHGARPAQPGGRPGGRPGSRSPSLLHRLRGGPAAPEGRPTSCPTRLVSALTGRLRNYTAAPDPGRVEARTAGHRRASRRSGAVPGRDVPGQARAADGRDDGRR